MTHTYNFNAGPAILPRPVLEHAQQELVDYCNTGMSVLEISHRSKEYEEINAQAEHRLKELLGLGNDYRVLFVQGGASLQFSMVPMNYLRQGQVADYILTGVWSDKAIEEARKLGQTHIAASTKAEGYTRIPTQEEITLSDSPAYVHLTSNNTIYGTQWHYWPEVGDQPLIADMSSDILSRPLDARKFALIYAGAQKNLGPAGVTVVIIRSDWAQDNQKSLPTVLQYATYARTNSLYNTPPVFAVYMVNLVLGWLEQQGGLEAMGRRNEEKARIVYDAIDRSHGFYRGHAVPDSCSWMNVTFHLPNEELEQRFVSEGKAHGFVGIAGHRSVGGIRVSLYNAMDLDGPKALAQFMDEFARREG